MRALQILIASMATTALFLTGCGGSSSGGGDTTDRSDYVSDSDKKKALSTYADIAGANYADALSDAEALKTAIDAFVATPTEAKMTAAKEAWLTARESYGTTEIFRLSAGPIDAEEGWVKTLYESLEPQINAWPLDENMIDYTIDENGDTTSGNIIDTAGSFSPSGTTDTVDVTTINKATLADLNELGGEANVATGYHAIEFLLWGQDQDYENGFVVDNVTNGALVAGERPLADFTSDTHAERRKDYLSAAAELLVDNLTTVTNAWKSEGTPDCTSGTGCYRAAFLGELSGDDAEKNIVTDTALRQVMTGMGVFLKSELANERIAVAVLTPSEEDEHSCFSDNTHRDIVTNYQGFISVLKGRYDGDTAVDGTGMYGLLDKSDREMIDKLIADIDPALEEIDTLADETCHFDYQIKDAPGVAGCDNKTRITAMKNNMRDLADEMVTVGEAFGVSFTKEDVRDSEETEI